MIDRKNKVVNFAEYAKKRGYPVRKDGGASAGKGPVQWAGDVDQYLHTHQFIGFYHDWQSPFEAETIQADVDFQRQTRGVWSLQFVIHDDNFLSSRPQWQIEPIPSGHSLYTLNRRLAYHFQPNFDQKFPILALTREEHQGSCHSLALFRGAANIYVLQAFNTQINREGFDFETFLTPQASTALQFAQPKEWTFALQQMQQELNLSHLI